MVPIKEEPVLALYFLILQLISGLMKEQPGTERNPEHPEEQTRYTSKESPEEVRPTETLDIEISDQSEV